MERRGIDAILCRILSFERSSGYARDVLRQRGRRPVGVEYRAAVREQSLGEGRGGRSQDPAEFLLDATVVEWPLWISPPMDHD
jgi:hypothetical protein